jgi:hypothetical protein
LHENPFSSCSVVKCGNGDRHSEADKGIFATFDANAPKIGYMI